MMRRTLIVAAALATLAACASNGPEGNAWYQQGDADYDALKQASEVGRNTFQPSRISWS